MLEKDNPYPSDLAQPVDHLFQSMQQHFFQEINYMEVEKVSKRRLIPNPFLFSRLESFFEEGNTITSRKM